MIVFNLFCNLYVPIKQLTTKTLADIRVEECLNVNTLLKFSTEHQLYATPTIMNRRYKAVKTTDSLLLHLLKHAHIFCCEIAQQK